MSETVEVTKSTKIDPLVLRRKVALMESGVTGDAIAQKLGVTRQAVSLALLGKRRTPRIQKAIADAVGASVEYLFPAA